MRDAHMIECCVAGSAHRGEMVLYPLRKLWLKRGARPLDEQRMLDMLPSVAIWQTQPVVSVKRRYKETPFFYKMEWFIELVLCSGPPLHETARNIRSMMRMFVTHPCPRAEACIKPR